MCQCGYAVVHFLLLSGLNFFVVRSYITEPHLTDLSNGHTIVGESITLKCTVTSDTPRFSIEWNAPINLNLTLDRLNITTITEKQNPEVYKMTSTYSISDSKLADASIYYCTALSSDNPFDTKYTYIWVPVYGTNESVVEFYKNLTMFDQARAEVQVYVRAHPKTRFYWIDKNNNTILPESPKFTSGTSLINRFTNYKIFLRFKRISPGDFGNYTMVAENKYGSRRFVVPINATGVPASLLMVENFDNDTKIVKCQATAYPKPKIEWDFDACDGLSCFLESLPNVMNTSKWAQFRSEDVGLQTVSYVTVNKSDVGQLRAVSSNSFGSNTMVQHIYEGAEDFEVFSPNMLKNGSVVKLETVLHDDIEIVCALSLNSYYLEIKWYRSGRNLSLDDVKAPIKGFDEYHITNYDAVYSKVSVLKMNVGLNDEGQYFCKGSTKSGKTVSKVITVVVKELPTLNVATNMQNNTVKVKLGNSWRFYCNADGYPTPFITWYKDNNTIISSEKLTIKDNNQTLIVQNMALNDNGTYACEISNRLNVTTKIATLESLENEFDWLMTIIVALVVILIVVTGLLGVKFHKDNKLKRELEAAGLANFEEGAVESMNPELGLDQQANLLPYDKKFEILPNQLKLGKELGSGAFGVVVKGELTDFPVEQTTTTVAVKTVNKLAGHDCIKALASELKIMIHLGRHVNIVNLIGACTKDIAKQKLLVLVEFCPYGNLHDYILQHSNNFIDQKKGDAFDWGIREILDYSTKSGDQNDKKYISSQDFLVWALQITKGMEYLATNKVLHGDLAARNVLLSENNVVKISDFGLARNMYKNDVYKKTSNEPLPVKWMALESIGEAIFSTQSDIWSFGVVLWEFFSLGKTPYPGMPVDQTFYKQLYNGYRMDKPEFATTDIHKLMLDCWNSNPSSRPSFTKLASSIGGILAEPIKNHYLQMNSCYVLMKNPQTEDECNIDYVNNINYFHSYQNASIIADSSDKSDLHDDCNYVGM